MSFLLALLFGIQSPSQVEAALRVYAGDLHGCYARALAADGSLQGQVSVHLVLDAESRVQKSLFSDDQIGSPILTTCLRERMKSWKLDGAFANADLVFPLIFKAAGTPHAVKVADVEPVPKTPEVKPNQPPRVLPLKTWLLLDEKSVGAKKAVLTVVQVGPKAKIAMHKHPVSSEILYVLEGHGRLMIPGAAEPEKLEPGTAVFIKAGTPHSIDDQSSGKTLRLLQSFVPPGPEKVLRDRSQSAGTVVLKGAVANAAPGTWKVVHPDDVQPHVIAGGKAKVWILLEKATTGEDAAYLGVLEADAGAKVPEHKHDTSAELLFIQSGAVKTTIAGQDTPGEEGTAIYIPEDTPHSATFTAATRSIQLYAPAGPEQRFKAPAGPQK